MGEYLKILAGIGFLVLLLTFWFWCFFVAYPIVLDSFIKKGKYWLYLPIRWHGTYKVLITRTTQLWEVLILATGALSLWLYLSQLGTVYIIASYLAFFPLLFFLNRIWLKIRLNQQAESYFYIRNQIAKEREEKGQKLSDAEVDNLASFQHQNILREADQKGTLIKQMSTQSSSAKRGEKMEIINET